MLSNLGDREHGVAFLRRAVDRGFYAAPTLAASPAFDGLREDPAFIEVLAHAEAGRAKALAAYREAGGEELLGMWAAAFNRLDALLQKLPADDKAAFARPRPGGAGSQDRRSCQTSGVAPSRRSRDGGPRGSSRRRSRDGGGRPSRPGAVAGMRRQVSRRKPAPRAHAPRRIERRRSRRIAGGGCRRARRARLSPLPRPREGRVQHAVLNGTEGGGSAGLPTAWSHPSATPPEARARAGTRARSGGSRALSELKSMDQRTRCAALSTAEAPYSRTTITVSPFEARLGPIVPVGIFVLQRATPSVGLRQ